MKKKKRNFYWKLCYWFAILLAVITFTPIVIPYGKIEPAISNIPYTLWMGILIYILFVLVTFIGTKVYPENDDNVK